VSDEGRASSASESESEIERDDAIGIAIAARGRIALTVFAEPPLPSRCLPKLRDAYTPEWIAGLYAAMLRDTLDGLQSIAAAEHRVHSSSSDDEAKRAFLRCLPAPWQLIADAAEAIRAPLVESSAQHGVVILARSDAPAAAVAPLVDLLERTTPIETPGEAFAFFGPAGTGHERHVVGDGRAWIVGASETATSVIDDLPWDAAHELVATMRARCATLNVPLHELASATIVDEPTAVVALLDELRRYPERAPRTAQFLVTRS
jgi:hypothetical protein